MEQNSGILHGLQCSCMRDHLRNEPQNILSEDKQPLWGALGHSAEMEVLQDKSDSVTFWLTTAPITTLPTPAHFAWCSLGCHWQMDPPGHWK